MSGENPVGGSVKKCRKCCDTYLLFITTRTVIKVFSVVSWEDLGLKDFESVSKMGILVPAVRDNLDVTCGIYLKVVRKY